MKVELPKLQTTIEALPKTLITDDITVSHDTNTALLPACGNPNCKCKTPCKNCHCKKSKK